ncbi:MAG: PTS system mannose/fructose/sorbose family transporter subunit IID [Lachnospiraceae bacterium]|nr:PTS system mannose/fructose/sorbose family transporter subunit IID [Lachnospiraceae bacterium]
MSESRITKKDLRKVYLRHLGTMGLGYNAAKQENTGMSYCLYPIIKKVYDNKEDRIAALERENEYYLSQMTCTSLNVGIAAAMEEKNATDPDFDENSINAVKAATMSPLAAIGDSLVQGTLRPLFAGIAISMVTASNYTSVVGPAIFFIVMFLLSVIPRYFGVFQGYKQGSRAVEMIQKTGIMDLVTKLAGVAGYLLIGAFAYSMVSVNVPFEFTSGETVINLQETLNSLVPNCLSLVLIFICYKLLAKKKVSAIVLLLALLVLGVIGVYAGFLA